MSDSQTFEPLTRDTLDEHRQIHFFLDQVLASLETLATSPTDTEPLRRLAAQLQGLAERLAEHNRAEERAGGWFQAILEALPDKRVEIERLANEHHRFVEILEMARLHAGSCEPSEAASLRDDLAGYLDAFRRHEHAEETLLRMAIERQGTPHD